MNAVDGDENCSSAVLRCDHGTASDRSEDEQVCSVLEKVELLKNG